MPLTIYRFSFYQIYIYIYRERERERERERDSNITPLYDGTGYLFFDKLQSLSEQEKTNKDIHLPHKPPR